MDIGRDTGPNFSVFLIDSKVQNFRCLVKVFGSQKEKEERISCLLIWINLESLSKSVRAKKMHMTKEIELQGSELSND